MRPPEKKILTSSRASSVKIPAALERDLLERDLCLSTQSLSETHSCNFSTSRNFLQDRETERTVMAGTTFLSSPFLARIERERAALPY